MNKMVKFLVVGALGFMLLRPATAEAIERQRAMNWCWASAIQDVYRMAGGNIEQVQVAAILDGWPRDRPAHIAEVIAVLNYLKIRASFARVLTGSELLGVLRARQVVIAFVMPNGGNVGHYIVIKGYDPSVDLLIVADPWTGREQYQTLQQLYQGWHWMGSVIAG